MKKIKRKQKGAGNSPTEGVKSKLKGLGASPKNFMKPRLSKKAKMPDAVSDIESDVPRITNDTVEQHRKEVIKGGRKYKYPIINTPKRVLGLSLVVGLVALLIFSSLTVLRLYRYNGSSDFEYNITKVLPLPVARVGGSIVYYEDYLFELRRFIHYFETQQNVDFSVEQDSTSLASQQQRSLQKVIDDVYIAKLARQNNVSVSSEEVNAEIDILREQNKLGSNQQAFEEVLLDFWGWSLDDYKKSVKKELLKQKVTEAIDTQALATAQEVVRRLSEGEDFTALAVEYSQDPASAENGGEYGFPLNLEERNEDPKVLQAVFSTEIGGVTEIINTGYKLEIIKVLAEQDGSRQAAHISIFFTDINEAINNLKAEQPARVYINVE